jgi:putative molybdopterin biosynthesis protein
MLVTLAHRQQGLIVPPGNPRGFRGLDEAVGDGARIVNRNRGSGTRVWLDRVLAGAGIDTASVAGYEREVATHEQAARAVADGTADVALGIFAAARTQGLDFVPLMEERYDLVTPTPVYESDLMAPLLEMLHDEGFKRSVDGLGGYATRETGAARILAA